jgi:hypothetical protein
MDRTTRRPPHRHHESGTGRRPLDRLDTWRKRVTAALLSVGALAGAATAVINLWPSPDLQDEAHLTSVSAVPMSLPEFVQRQESALRSAGRDQARAVQLVAVTRTTALDTAASSTATSPATTGGSTSATPTTPTATTPATPSASTSTTPAATATYEGPLHRWRPTLDSLVADQSERVLRAFPTPVPSATVAYIVRNTQTGPDGEPLDPQQAADAVVAVFAQARTEPVSHDALGMMVTADLQVVGLRGQPLVLSWSLLRAGGKTPLPAAWRGTTTSSRLVPSTDSDTGVSEVWVPLPRADGSYVAQLSLRLDGALLAQALSPPFH